jgi:hypothetical protein
LKKKVLLVLFIIYIIIVLLVTKTLLDKNENGVFDTKNYYYVCSEKISEYDKSSLVRFDKKVDYEKMVDSDVYYFDNDNNIQNGKLIAYDKENEIFTVGDDSYKKDKLLGRADKGYQFVGSLLNFLTSRIVYLVLFIIPILALLIYEIVVFIRYCYRDKNTVDNNEKKKKQKK